jgi:DNA modification methylase
MKESDLFKLHLEDARNLIKIIPKNTVDVTITSPPYGNLKNYEKGISPDIKSQQIGFGQDYEVYLNDLQKIFKDIFNVTKTTGSLWVVVDTFDDNGKMRLLPFDLTKKLEKVGWKLKDIIIWNKISKTSPWTAKNRFKKIFEYVLFFVKSKNFKYKINRIKDPNNLKHWWIKYPERYNPKGKTPTNIWDFQIPTQGSWGNGYIRHFCPFPIGLVEQILLLTTDKNHVVVDPFSGSGVVLAVAECMKRKYIGFEINNDYINDFHNKVLPQIRKEYTERESELKRLSRQRLRKKDQIKKLRLVKYPKTLINEILKLRNKEDLNSFPLHSVFAISQNFDEMKEDIFLIFDKEIDTSKLNEDIEKLSKRYPLSKFGIDAKISIYNKKEFIENYNKFPLFNESDFWLYTKGVTNAFEKPITISEWINNFQTKWFDKKSPPIISNLKVNVLFNEDKNKLTRFLK